MSNQSLDDLLNEVMDFDSYRTYCKPLKAAIKSLFLDVADFLPLDLKNELSDKVDEL